MAAVSCVWVTNVLCVFCFLGTNACSKKDNGCRFLCVGEPAGEGAHGANRTCLCPEGYGYVKQGHNEQCVCPNGETFVNGSATCTSVG